MRDLAKLGITHYHGPVPNVASIAPIEVLGQWVIPVVDGFQVRNDQPGRPTCWMPGIGGSFR